MSSDSRYTYQAAHTGANVKDSPEPGEIPALLVFGRVGHHDHALGRPQDTRTGTQQSTGEDVEARNIFMHRDEKTDRVDAISNSTEGERQSDTDPVDDGASEETHHGEHTIQSEVLYHENRLVSISARFSSPHFP